MFFQKHRLSKLGSIFDAILVPTWLHFAFPNPPKSFKNPTPRAIKILIDFCFDFLSILAPFWGPSWSHVGHLFRAKTPPGRPQDAPRRPQDTHRRPRTPQDAPKTPPRRPKPSPDNDFGEVLKDFGKFFGRLFGNILLSSMPPQTYFRKKPASTNSISKKANLKNRGPAVIAAGVGNYVLQWGVVIHLCLIVHLLHIHL